MDLELQEPGTVLVLRFGPHLSRLHVFDAGCDGLAPKCRAGFFFSRRSGPELPVPGRR